MDQLKVDEQDREVAAVAAAAAQLCLSKEEELMSLWKTIQMFTSPEDILPFNTIVESRLIQGHAHSILFLSSSGGHKFPPPAATAVTAAVFSCIAKEAELSIELLKLGADPIGDMVLQSSAIRMCSLSVFVHLHQLQLHEQQGCQCHQEAAAAAVTAMASVTRACSVMCDWLKEKTKLVGTSAAATSDGVQECSSIRGRALDVMLSIVNGDSSFSSSPPSSSSSGLEWLLTAATTGSAEDLFRSTTKDHAVTVISCTAADGDGSEDEDRESFETWAEFMEDADCGADFPPFGIVRHPDLLAKTWGWDRLVPFLDSIEVEWSDHCSYLHQYYSHNATAAAAEAADVADAAKLCLDKEEELLWLWNKISTKSCTDDTDTILLRSKNIILSKLIQDLARASCSSSSATFFTQGNNGRQRRGLSDASAAAAAVLLSGFRCIAKEADLIGELLRRGADPMYYLIVQSNLIRMCALSLMMNSCRICDPVAAAASMVGITKETATMCEWMQEHDGEVFDPSSLSLPISYELGHIIRYRTLHFMTTVLEKSPMPSASAVAVVSGHKKSTSSAGVSGSAHEFAPVEDEKSRVVITMDKSKMMRIKDENGDADGREFDSCQKRSKVQSENKESLISMLLEKFEEARTWCSVAVKCFRQVITRC